MRGTLLSLMAIGLAPVAVAQTRDTIRIEVGSPVVDGRVYQEHAARVRVRVGAADSRITGEWTNELTLGDSAGRTGVSSIRMSTLGRTSPSMTSPSSSRRSRRKGL